MPILVTGPYRGGIGVQVLYVTESALRVSRKTREASGGGVVQVIKLGALRVSTSSNTHTYLNTQTQAFHTMK